MTTGQTGKHGWSAARLLAPLAVALVLAAPAGARAANDAGYVGCYTDDENRGLPTTLAGGGQTPASCMNLARQAGLRYAGLQWYGQCFGGNELRWSPAAETDCSTPCDANPSWTCGGGWRNSIYDTNPGVSTVISPQDFEGATVGGCPAGWTCSGDAVIASASDGRGCVAASNGGKYAKAGCDGTTGTLRSPTFTLPANAARVLFGRAGGADGPGSGLFVRRASDNWTVCAATNGADSDSFFDDTCNGLSAAAGQAVYIEIIDAVNGGWGKTYVDNIRIQDANGTTLGVSSGTAPPPPPPPQAYGEWEELNPAGSVYINSSITVSGWVADSVTGTAGLDVNVYVNGVFHTPVHPTVARPDVSGFFGRSDFLYSGWTATIDTCVVGTGNVTVDVWMGGAGAGRWLHKTVSLHGGSTFSVVADRTIDFGAPGTPAANATRLNALLTDDINLAANKDQAKVLRFAGSGPFDFEAGSAGQFWGIDSRNLCVRGDHGGATTLSWRVSDGPACTSDDQCAPWPGQGICCTSARKNRPLDQSNWGDSCNEGTVGFCHYQPHSFFGVNASSSNVHFGSLAFTTTGFRAPDAGGRQLGYRHGDGTHIKIFGRDVAVRHCTFSWSPGFALSVDASNSGNDYIAIELNSFTRSIGDGVHVHTGSGISIVGNYFNDCGDDAIAIYNDGHCDAGNGKRPENITITRNTVENGHWRGLLVGASKNVRFENNDVKATAGYGQGDRVLNSSIIPIS
ncbi:MAG TPA: WSC domain-containing protein [Polyangia bacterium]|jgi:hypothetical protein